MADDLDDIDALAAGYVLGQLETAEQAEVQRRLATDGDFARRVAEWENRLLPLAEAAPAVTPPPGVWRRIEAVTGGATVERAGVSAAVQSLRPKLRFWRWATAGAAAAAAALALFVVLQPAPPSPRWVAVLGEGGAQPAWLVTVDIEARSLTVRPVTAEAAVAAGPDRALELWLVADGTPRSLGLLDPDGARSLALPAAATAPPPGSALAVSVEPEGGSPTGLPTGPVIFQGRLLGLGEK